MNKIKLYLYGVWLSGIALIAVSVGGMMQSGVSVPYLLMLIGGTGMVVSDRIQTVLGRERTPVSQRQLYASILGAVLAIIGIVGLVFRVL